MVETELHEQEMLYPTVEFPPAEDLPAEDGIPLESPWHRDQISLSLESIAYLWRDRTDYYAGGNMFIYYSRQQVRNRDYKGPDFFIVQGVDGTQERKSWVVWEEEGRYPDLIIELLSPSTARQDKTTKKRLYERVFRTAEYYGYDPDTQELFGWHLHPTGYEDLEPDPETGRLWSGVLNAWIGQWQGKFVNRKATWLRFFDDQGELIPIFAEAEAARAEAEAAARQTAEAEIARLQAELARLREQLP